jgi:hypothetical protein
MIRTKRHGAAHGAASATFFFVAALLLIPTTSVRAQTRPPEPAATLIELWLDANGRCRGGAGDAARTDAACAERERLGGRLDGLDWCYGKRGQIGAEMQWHRCMSTSLRAGPGPAPSTQAPTPSIQALQGKWYLDDQKVCKGRPNETEGLLTFRGMNFQGYENDCKIQSAKPNGRFLALRMMCAGEGMVERVSENIELVDDRTIRRSFKDGSKTYSSLHRRCPD